jgi:hypothetical protein
VLPLLALLRLAHVLVNLELLRQVPCAHARQVRAPLRVCGGSLFVDCVVVTATPIRVTVRLSRPVARDLHLPRTWPARVGCASLVRIGL